MEVPVRIGRVQSLYEHLQDSTPHGLATKELFDGVRGCVFSVHLQTQSGSGSKPPAALSHLVFRNYYTAVLRLVQVNCNGTFTVVLEAHSLMQHIHCEDDAQNWHMLPLDKMPIDMNTLESFCVYLFQPSPLWEKWELQHLKFFQARACAAIPSGITTPSAASGASSSKANSHNSRESSSQLPRTASPGSKTQRHASGSASSNSTQTEDRLTKRPSRLALMACVEAKDVQESATQCLALVSRLRHLLHASHEL